MRCGSFFARATPTLRDELRPLGFSVDWAHNRGDAIARARTDYYAIILVDFELPDADGISLIRRLRERPETYNTPIVIISADRVGEKDEASVLDVFKWTGKHALFARRACGAVHDRLMLRSSHSREEVA